MRCKRAQECYCKHRDGLLDEPGRLRLQEHLKECTHCQRFVAEMDACLDLLHDLPEESPSEQFEWNLKRRLMHERTRLQRRDTGVLTIGRSWSLRFVAGTAAAAVIVLAAFWIFTSSLSPRDTELAARKQAPQAVRVERASGPAVNGTVSYNHRGYPVSIRMASEEYVSGPGQRFRQIRSNPFQTVGLSREEQLELENEELRRRVQELEKEKEFLLQMLRASNQQP